MEVRVLVSLLAVRHLTQRQRLLSTLIVGSLIAITAFIADTTIALAKESKSKQPFIAKPVSAKQSIRFYRANKQLQADRVKLTGGDTDQTGCHNLLKKTRVFKALQIGFTTCSLYAEKNCTVASLVPAQSEDQLYNTFLLTEGIAWFVQGEDERGEKVASWSCEMEIQPGEMRYENDLAFAESARLKRLKKSAKQKLNEAQAAYAKIEKSAIKARKYAKKAKAEGIAMGAIEPDPEPDEDKKDSKSSAKSKGKVKQD